MPKKLSKEKFISKAKYCHNNKYDYSFVEYKENKTKVIIVCPEHGEFCQQPSKHLLGQGCPKCSNQRLDLYIFISKSNQVHNHKYDYSKVVYINWKTKVRIICPKHGEFLQIPNSHLGGSGCSICKSSKGELQVEQWLQSHKIKFITQKKFTGCRGKVKPLPFDFYLPELNTCIEYQGKQHYQKESRFYSEELMRHDKTKAQYCLDNNIRLIVIPYYENTEEMLRTFCWSCDG